MALAFVSVALILFIGSFLIGSVPFGLIISKYFYKKDIRDHGSGNIGATNALRVLGKKAGAVVFLLDFAKGLVASLLGWCVGSALLDGSDAYAFSGISAYTCLAFLAVVLGHCFSPWLDWKGGKGIAAAGGGLFVVLGPLFGLLELVGFGIVAGVSRYVSLGSLTAAWLLLPFSAYKFLLAVPAGQNRAWLAFAFCVAAIIVVTVAHRGNIARLRAGTENRLGGKKSDLEAK